MRDKACLAVIILVTAVLTATTTVYVYPDQTQSQPRAQTVIANTSESLQPVYDAYKESVVAIKTITSEGSSQGTGFVYDGAGHIVTNHHVIDDAIIIEVRFPSGEWRQAKLVGSDVYSDTAVLRVQEVPDAARPLPIAEENPEPGTKVVALGNPYGLQGTITHGIISGVDRTMETAAGFTIPDTIQTDAPINPGNSGGPLITYNGTVVGVNRAKQGDNIGFAISPAILNRVIPSLIEKGVYHHPYLGIGMRDLSPRIAEVNDVDAQRGVLVTTVQRHGPANGVLRGSQVVAVTSRTTLPVGGDIITHVEGRRVTSSQQLIGYLATKTRPGQTVHLTIIRDGERQTVTVTLDRRPQPALTRYDLLR